MHLPIRRQEDREQSMQEKAESKGLGARGEIMLVMPGSSAYPLGPGGTFLAYSTSTILLTNQSYFFNLP